MEKDVIKIRNYRTYDQFIKRKITDKYLETYNYKTFQKR